MEVQDVIQVILARCASASLIWEKWPWLYSTLKVGGALGAPPPRPLICSGRISGRSRPPLDA